MDSSTSGETLQPAAHHSCVAASIFVFGIRLCRQLRHQQPWSPNLLCRELCCHHPQGYRPSRFFSWLSLQLANILSNAPSSATRTTSATAHRSLGPAASSPDECRNSLNPPTSSQLSFGPEQPRTQGPPRHQTTTFSRSKAFRCRPTRPTRGSQPHAAPPASNGFGRRRRLAHRETGSSDLFQRGRPV